ncbi:hypothetical protein CC86DRAFT_368589, partial [Ophiobolus disseminans]
MKFFISIALLFGATALALPTAPLAAGGLSARTESASGMARLCSQPSDADITPDNDDYVVYPDVDGDEDVVYAYHAIND